MKDRAGAAGQSAKRKSATAAGCRGSRFRMEGADGAELHAGPCSGFGPDRGKPGHDSSVGYDRAVRLPPPTIWTFHTALLAGNAGNPKMEEIIMIAYSQDRTSPVPTTKSLARQAARLDRQRRASAAVIGAMRAGAALHMRFTTTGPSWALSDGKRVNAVVAQLVVNHPEIVGCGDTLFRGSTSQTFRYAAD
jgi:hypothetical protein